MRRLLLLSLLLAAPVFAAGDTPLAPEDPQLAAARAEVARASAEEQRLERAAAQAGSEAQRLAAEQQAAAAAIGAAEARISIAEAQLSNARIALARSQQQMAERQAPVAGLLAGLVSMGRRPPLLALADGSAEEFVRVRALLDATMPAIRARTAALAAELASQHRAEQAALSFRAGLDRERQQLAHQRTRFAALEQRALARQGQLAGRALGAGDVSLAGTESLAAIGNEAERRRAGLIVARELAALDPLPARPFRAEGGAAAAPLAYELPASAPLTAGFGSVDANGVRSRGLTLATGRGTPVASPADGTIAFAGPFRHSDGVVIIDHGGGWMSLLVNVATTLQKGSRVARGDPLGRTLGPLDVELSKGGRNVSPALIAASSAMLSNGTKGG